MSFRSALARWLQPGATPLPDLAATVRDLATRVATLELERPAFVAELESMLDTVQEILGRSESKRARATALESKRKARDEQPELEATPDRATVLAEVRARLRSQGKNV